MTIKLIEKKVFTIKIGETELDNFKEVSTWLNFIELKNPQGETLVVGFPAAESPFKAAFNNLFTYPTDPIRDVVAISGTPRIIELIKAEDPHANN